MTPRALPVVAAFIWVLVAAYLQPVHGWQFHDAPPIEGARKGVPPPEFAPKQWRVNTTGGLLTIFMPVIPTEMELGYARNQLRTFERLFDLSTIKEWMIVTPQDHMEDVKVGTTCLLNFQSATWSLLSCPSAFASRIAWPATI